MFSVSAKEEDVQSFHGHFSLRYLLLAFFSLSLPLSASAATNVLYLDADGVSQIAPTATDLTGAITTLNAGWYVTNCSVTNPIAYSNTITISGDVHLILADGCALTVSTGAAGNAGIRVAGANSLTVYAQSTGAGMGSLAATGRNGGAGIGGRTPGETGGTVTINGGTVTASGNSGLSGSTAGAGIGGGGAGDGIAQGGAGGTVTINGGTVNCIGDSANGFNGAGAGIGGGGGSSGRSGGAGGTITINGGAVNCIGGNSSTGFAGAGIGGGGSGGGSNAYYGVAGTILIYGESTKVTAQAGTTSATGVSVAAQDIGAGGGRLAGAAGNVFVALLPANLQNGSGSIGNAVTFSASPPSPGTVTAELPAPFSTTMDLLTGLTTPRMLSVITTLSSDSVTFELADYPPAPKTRAELMDPNVSVYFFLRGVAQSVPALTPAMLVLLALALGFAGVRRRS
ncbi:MAG: hypothetical protein LBE75_04020 [Burkholderiales bacterium]|nr:hypothetical protein [Burkholderiales bacterium]